MNHRLRNCLHFSHEPDDLAGDDLGAGFDAGGTSLGDFAVPDDAGSMTDLHGVHDIVEQVRPSDYLAVLDSQNRGSGWSV